MTPLHIAAKKGGRSSLADINIQDNNGVSETAY